MANQDSGYFGMKIGDALSSGAGHIANALQRKYEMQKQNEMKMAELARQDEIRQQDILRQQQGQQQQTQMQFAAQGLDYDPNNPAGSFEQFASTMKQRKGQEAQIAQAGLDKTRAETAKIAGARAEEASPMQSVPAELGQMGVPGTRVNPYATMPDNVRAKVQPANIQFANRMIEKANAAQNTAEGANAELNRVKALLDSGMQTGPVVGMAKRVGQYLIPGDGLTKQVASFEQVANKLIPTMRQGMPGAASDRDVAMFAKATIGIDKPEEVNRQIIDQMLLVNRRIADKANFLASYVNAYGDAQGAEMAWGKYINENPLFDDNGTPLPYKTYNDYFGGGSSGGGQAKPAADPMGLF